MSTPFLIAVPDDRLRAALEASAIVQAHARVMVWDTTTPAPRPDIDIVVPPYAFGVTVFENLRGVDVKLVQWQSIGYDGVNEELPAGIPFANATSVHETSTAELAVGLAIAMQRDIPRAIAAAGERRWKTTFSPGLADRRVLLIGYGGVGKAIEARLMPFETELTRVASRARTETNSAGEEVTVHGIEELPDLLADAEIVIIGLPLNDHTRGLFDAELLERMADGALLVNVGRGPIVDTAALVAELQSGRIRAALDVVDPEPLPADHPLWECPNTLITPHVGGDTGAMLPRVVRLVERQLTHLVAGEPFENIVLGPVSGH